MNCIDVTPADVTQYITFNRDDPEWTYDELDNTSMYSKQAEGVAGLCHRLNQYSIAILADEVGMGKTMQAFGVLSMLWKDNPNARVLVFAPRREVAQNWSNEFNEFKNKHIKSNGLTLPSNAVFVHRLDHKDGNASKEMLPDLEDDRALQAKLIIAKITSLSYMHTSVKSPTLDDFIKKAKSLKDIMQGFDLIVVDEAHYLRNVDGDSIRANVAKELFSDLKPDVKILLMTATPNHNNKNDVVNIVSYFRDSIRNVPYDSKGILSTLAIRRLRRLVGKTKYQYRKETALKANFESNKECIDNNELFFALYQKKIVEEGIGCNNTRGRAFWNYLEGTEFNPSRLEELLKKSDSEDEQTENISTDYNQADDRQVLLSLLKNYQKAFKGDNLPSNPKYEKMVNELVAGIGQDKQSNHKALIFVRRIPSAEEITRKVIDHYDLYLWSIIQESIQIPKRQRKIFQRSWNRKWFERWIQKQHNIPAINLEDDFDDEVNHDEQLENYTENTSEKKSTYRSVVLSWFKRPGKDKKDISTHAYRFVRRFDQDGAYSTFFSYDPDKNTLWSHIKNSKWDKMSNAQKISFASLIKKAVLHASVGVVELYSCFLRSSGKYNDFFNIVLKDLENMIFYHQIIEMLNHFEIFYSKIMGIPEEELPKQQWDLFNNSQPAYGYVGGTRNKTVLNTFNTPFFPDVITATSVLQEGVNLQYYCKKIYHYGVAWSPGDDEQRIGRIDRMFGMVERNLKQSISDTTLDIYYPYLDATHDANVLTNFLDKKRKAEVELDHAKILIHDNSLQDNIDPNMIEKLLLEPKTDGIHHDPYPYKRNNHE